MRIIMIGATGTIGRELVDQLGRDHEIVPVTAHSGEFQVDIASKDSIERLFAAVGPFDAVICAAGAAQSGTLDRLSDEDFMLGLTNKLMGQVNVVRVGHEYINDNGSFTLTSGMPAAKFVPAYKESVESQRTGEVLDVRDFVLDYGRPVGSRVYSPGESI